MPNPSTYFYGSLAQKPATANSSSVIAPIFSGITTLVSQSDGSLLATWSTYTGSPLTPVSYLIYIALGTVSAGALFINGNIVSETRNLSSYVYTLSNLTNLTTGQTYTVGVRAVSAANISETNTALISTVLTGVDYGNILSLVPSYVWDQLKSAHTISGSFGDYLDAKVSLSQTTATALSQYNALVTAIGTLQTSATALTQFNALDSSIALLQTASTALTQYGALITAIGTPQQNSTALTQYNNLTSAINLTQTAAIALSQFNTIIADIAAITAPDNADIVAIKAVTDKFIFDGSNYVNAHTKVNDDKTLYTPDAITSAKITAIDSKTTNLPSDPASTTDITTAESTLATDIVGVQSTTYDVKKLSNAILGNVV